MFNNNISAIVCYPAKRTETEYSIPETVKWPGAFTHCIRLNDITVDENNTSYSSEDGVLYDKTGTCLVQYPDGGEHTNFIVPDGVKTIKAEALYSTLEFNLRTIVLPQSLEYIEKSCFSIMYPNAIFYRGTETMWNDNVI